MSKVYEAYLSMEELMGGEVYDEAFWEANYSENEEVSGDSKTSINDEEVRDGL